LLFGTSDRSAFPAPVRWHFEAPILDRLPAEARVPQGIIAWTRFEDEKVCVSSDTNVCELFMPCEQLLDNVNISSVYLRLCHQSSSARTSCSSKFGMLPETAAECPAERMRLVTIPVFDEPLDLRAKCVAAAEFAIPDHSPLENGKPQLNLVHPGSVLRREDEIEPCSMPPIERFPSFPSVNVEVVPDDENFSLGVTPRNRLHELVEVLRGSASATLSEYLSSANIKRGKQGDRPVALVFKLETPRRTGLRVDDRMLASHCLNAGLLVDAQDGRSERRCPVQPTNPLHFGAKFRIRTMKPKPHPVWAKVLTPKDASDFAAAESNPCRLVQCVPERWISPDLVEGCMVVRWSAAGELHQLTPRFNLYLGRSATSRPVSQRSYDGIFREARPPLSHSSFTAAELSRDVWCRNRLGTEQDHPSSLDSAMSRHPAAADPFQFTSNGWGEKNCPWFRTSRHARGRSRLSLEVQKISRIELQARCTSRLRALAVLRASLRCRRRRYRGCHCSGRRSDCYVRRPQSSAVPGHRPPL